MRQNEILDKSKEMLRESEVIAECGCYFLSLCYAGVNAANIALKKKRRELLYSEILSNYEIFVEDKLMDEDCFIVNPTGILSYLTGREWTVNKSEKFDEKADIAIALWFNKNTGFHHFVLMKDKDTVLWDPLYESKTVAEGVIESWRLFYSEE